MPVVHIIKKKRTTRAPGLALCGKKFLLPVAGATDMNEVTCRKCLAIVGSETPKRLLIPKFKDETAKLSAHIGRQVRQYRKEIGLNQGEFGALLGRTQTWVSSMELGVYRFDLPLLAALEYVLKKPLDSFLPKRRYGKFEV